MEKNIISSEQTKRLKTLEKFIRSSNTAADYESKNDGGSSADMFTSLNDIPTQTRSNSSLAESPNVLAQKHNYPDRIYENSIATSSCPDDEECEVFDSDINYGNDEDSESCYTEHLSISQRKMIKPHQNMRRVVDKNPADKCCDILKNIVTPMSAKRLPPIPETPFNSSPIKPINFQNVSDKLYTSTPAFKNRNIPENPDIILNGLADQLRGMMVVLELGVDDKREKLLQLEKIRMQKLKEREKDIEMQNRKLEEEKQKMERMMYEHQNRIKLEKEKAIAERNTEKELKAENIELKHKYNEQSRKKLDFLKQIDELKKKQAEMLKELEKTKEENKRKTERENNLRKRIEQERISKVLKEKAEIKEREQLQLENQQRYPPFQRVQLNKNPLRQKTFQQTTNQAIPTTFNFQNRQYIPAKSTATTPLIISPSSSYDDHNSLLNSIPDDLVCTQTIQTNKHTISEYSNKEMHVKWLKNISCGCESLHYDTNDYHYRSNYGVDVIVKHFAKNGQITITFSNLEIMSYPNKQLEIHRSNGEATVFAANGKRFERFNIDKEIINEVYDGNKRLRVVNNAVQEMEFDANRQSVREDGSYISCDSDGRTLIHHPEFRLGRQDSQGYDAVYQIQIGHTGATEYLQINVCPSHCVFFIKHCQKNDDNTISKNYCTSFNVCEHLKS